MNLLYYAYSLSFLLNFYILCIVICLILQLAFIAILIYKEQLALLLTLLFAFLVVANIILSTFAKFYFWYVTFYHFGFEQGLKMLFYELIKPFYLAIDFDISCSVVGGKNVICELAPAITFCKQLVFPKFWLIVEICWLKI